MSRLFIRKKLNTKSILKDQSGVTMVEVLIGFVILASIMAMLSGIIAFASNMYYESVDMRNAEQRMMIDYYDHGVVDSLSARNATITLRPVDGKGPSPSMDVGVKSLNTKSLSDVQAYHDLDMDLYFLTEAK